jgi:hypothetical protein
MTIKYGKTGEIKQSEHSSVAHEYDISTAYPAYIIVQIKAQPKRRPNNDVTMLGIDRELHTDCAKPRHSMVRLWAGSRKLLLQKC